MAAFLTDEWFAEVNGRGVTADPELSLVLEQRVTGGPHGEVRYRVVVSGGHLTVERLGPESPAERGEGGVPPADVVLRLDYATAAALASGRLTAQEAFLDARIGVTGDVSRLLHAGPALAAVADALRAAPDRGPGSAESPPVG